MTKSTYKVHVDRTSLEYVKQVIDEMDKNDGPDDILFTISFSDKSYINLDSSKCVFPVAKAKMGNLHFTDETWHKPHRVGHDPLERFMPFLSDKAKLLKKYNNHSIRVTVITTLDNNGIEARHI